MTLFSLMISLVNRELVFAVDSIRQPWLNFQRWFLVLPWLSFRWRFMDQHWHSVFDDSMHQTWIYFCYRLYASLVNSLTLSTPYVSCHSYLIGDFKVTSHSVFADDFWSVVTQFSLTIGDFKLESIFAIGFMRRSWILLTLSTPYVSCHSYFSGDFKVNSHSVFTLVAISRSTVTLFSLTIYGR